MAVRSTSRPSAQARSPTTLGTLLAERLRRAGVRRAYGFPGGGSNLDLIEAFHDAGIAWVLSHTEGGAAFMACADAEINRVPGVLVVGNGPGLTSAVNGVAHAWLDRVPLVVLSDRYTEEEAKTTGHQVLDQRGVLAPIVKFGATLEPVEAAGLIDRALATALEAPRGPVHLDMRRDEAGAAVVAAESAPVSRAGGNQASRSELLDDFARRLAEARAPVVLVGLEANDRVVPADLRDVVHASGAAVLTTYKAKGVYPEGDPRWAGVLTGAALERPLLERADLLLAVGLDPVELLARPWPYRAEVLSLAASAGSGDLYLSPRRRYLGDPGRAVATLARLLAERPATPGFPEDEVVTSRERALSSLRLDEAEPLPGWRIVETVMAELPNRSVVTVDAGAHMFAVTNFARPSGPRRFLVSNGLASMGFAVPAAVGAALACPDDVVVAFTGDGGMAYHVSELESAARLGARVIVVVFNDSSLSLIRIKQEAKGYSRSPLSFGLTEFDLIAEGLGVHGARVETEEALRRAFRDAVSRATSTVIDVRTTGRESAQTFAVIRG